MTDNQTKFDRDRAKSIIEEKGLRPKWVAEQMAVHPGTLYAWLNGDKDPSESMVILMASILGVKKDEIAA